MVNTVVGLLDTRSEAEKVVHDLESEGFPRNHIHVVASDIEREEAESGFRGLLVRLGLLESRRRELGLPAEHLGYYSEGVRRGGYLVTVDADTENEMDRAIDVLEDHGAVNIEERASEWQKSGWSSPAVGTAAATSTQPVREDAETRIPVVEEELKVGKRAVQRGGVRIYSHVTEQPVSEQVTLREEHVDIERRPVDRPATGADMKAFKEGTIELTETAEEAVAAKEARVVEEVTVGKGVRERTETIQDTVRRTEVEVEPLGPGRAGSPVGFEHFDPDFRQHYSIHFANLGLPYDQFLPAYHYGYTLGTDPAYADKDWATLSSDAQRQWKKDETRGKWDQMKAAVRYGWERARGRR